MQIIGKRKQQIRDRALRQSVQEAEKLLTAAERDVRQAQRALDTLQRREASGTKKRQRAGTSVGDARRRAQKLLSTVERNARDKRRLVRRLKEQAVRVDQSLTELRGDARPPAQHPAPISAAQLRAARALLGLSQKEMATRLGINPRQLGALEKQSVDAEARAVPADLVQRFKKLGVELVPVGLYVGAGGPGVRLKHRPTGARRKKPPAAAKAAARVPVRKHRVAAA